MPVHFISLGQMLGMNKGVKLKIVSRVLILLSFCMGLELAIGNNLFPTLQIGLKILFIILIGIIIFVAMWVHKLSIKYSNLQLLNKEDGDDSTIEKLLIMLCTKHKNGVFLKPFLTDTISAVCIDENKVIMNIPIRYYVELIKLFEDAEHENQNDKTSKEIQVKNKKVKIFIKDNFICVKFN